MSRIRAGVDLALRLVVPRMERYEQGDVFLLVVPRAGEPRLVEVAGRSTVVIGRGSECDVVLDDQKVSRRHAAIELVGGQHLLRDLASSNGTFVNGFRLSVKTAVALRDRDAVEVGDSQILYGPAAVLALGAGAHADAVLVTAPVRDLIAEGLLESAAAREAEAAIHRAFVDVPHVEGFERALEGIARRVEASSAAAFIQPGGGALRRVAEWPRRSAPSDAIAERAWRTGSGIAQRDTAPSAGAISAETAVEPTRASAAVALLHRGAPFGALAVERASGTRFDRATLARLAVMGDGLARTLALRSTAAGDTHVGLEVPVVDAPEGVNLPV